jgi:hypothetical protein
MNNAQKNSPMSPVTRRRRITSLATAFAMIAVLLSGCGESVPVTETVVVGGTITVPDGVSGDGKVRVSLYHAWALEGDLRHPVEFIESFETNVGPFSHSLEYPVELGQGLLVYAWLDTDGDGVLCTPADRDDLAGLTEVVEYPADSVTVEVQLLAPCAGPEWFYPMPD